MDTHQPRNVGANSGYMVAVWTALHRNPSSPWNTNKWVYNGLADDSIQAIMHLHNCCRSFSHGLIHSQPCDLQCPQRHNHLLHCWHLSACRGYCFRQGESQEFALSPSKKKKCRSAKRASFIFMRSQPDRCPHWPLSQLKTCLYDHSKQLLDGSSLATTSPLTRVPTFIDPCLSRHVRLRFSGPAT